MARYHGKNGRIYLGATHAGAATDLGGVSDWSFGGEPDKQDVTSMGDSNATYVYGVPDKSGKLSGFWDSAIDALFTADELGDSVPMYLYPSASAPTKYWYGFVNIALTNVKGGVKSAVALEATFVPAGTWARH